MYEEVYDAATSIDVGYERYEYFGLLAIVTGVNECMALTTKVYVNPTEPPPYKY